MSNIKELLEGVEIEWKKLDDIVEFRRGSFPQPYGNSKWYDGEGSMPFVQVADVSDNGFYLNENTKQKISKLAQPKSIFVEAGTVIVTLQGTIGRVAITQYDCYVDRTLAIFTNYKENINKKYFAYQLKSKFDLEKKYARGSTLKTITKEEFSKFEIPIPPLNIQNEIVRILDNFTELTAELTAELRARKKQYNHYRGKLLTFEDGEVEWKSLGEVAIKILSGGTPRTGVSEYYDGEIPWLRTQEVDFCDIWDTGVKITNLGLKNSSAKLIPKNCVIVAMYGATVGKIAINKIPLSTNQACANIQLDEEIVNYRYVFHYLTSKYEHIKSLGSGSQTNINAQIIKNYLIPIPPLAEQERIVNILDKFDTLTNSISEGLPKEIELRTKQYEYYRDLLLTFPKKVEA
jgi:type I restriction enzyme S subunit